MRVALIGYGNVGKAFARLLDSKRTAYPFRIVAVHTARHGTAYNPKGIGLEPQWSEGATSIGEFLDGAQADVAIEITTLNPENGQPAISHIKAAFERRLHVITANKGPIAHAYADLATEARRKATWSFASSRQSWTARRSSTISAQQFAGRRKCLAFGGVLNSTSKVVLAAMKRGLSMEEGIREAQAMGVAEADPWYDLDGWDSAAKAAALANVLMDARTTPQQVDRRGLRDMDAAELRSIAQSGRAIQLLCSGERVDGSVRLHVYPEVLEAGDLLAAVAGTSNLLLIDTDLMGTIGTLSINPGVEQTAYGLFSDLVDVAKAV